MTKKKASRHAPKKKTTAPRTKRAPRSFFITIDAGLNLGTGATHGTRKAAKQYLADSVARGIAAGYVVLGPYVLVERKGQE